MKKLISAICSGAVIFSAVAQNNPAVGQATTTQQQRETEKVLRDLAPGDSLPSLYSEEDADVGPQAVLRKKKVTWFRGSADAQVFYTDNMLYQNGDEQGAGVAVATLEAALTTPPCITRLASYRAEVGYRHESFGYAGHDNISGRLDAEDFDFDASTAFADVLAQTKHYQFRAGFDYTRLLGFEPLRRDDFDEFYTEYVPRWSVQRNFRVCDKSMFSLAYLGSYHFTDEDPRVIFSATPPSPILVKAAFPSDRSERWEHTLLAAYTMALPHHLVAQPYYRYQFTDFVNDADSVQLHTVGLGVGWIPCANFAVRGFFGYNWQRSDNRAAEYEQLNAGGGVNVTLRF